MIELLFELVESARAVYGLSARAELLCKSVNCTSAHALCDLIQQRQTMNGASFARYAANGRGQAGILSWP